MADYEPQGGPGDAFVFTGSWRDYMPIALSNLALSIVTLGIYRSWAKARERRYLWSNTLFIGDRLEWTGTGKEMFIGFLVAMAMVLPIFLFFQFGLQALTMRGHFLIAGIGFLAIYVAALYLFGFARFRSLRYRLTRSWWRGIRGGSDDPGFHYGWSAVWKPIVGAIPAGLLIPRSMVSLWNQRWNAMSFGPNMFESGASSSGLVGRWILILLAPLLGMAVMVVVAGGAFMSGRTPDPAMLMLNVVVLYGLMGIAGIAYYAAYFREAVGGLGLGQLNFEFDASSKDWLVLFLGDIALVVGTLGIGIAFLGYRHWSFFIRHMGAAGVVDVDALTQSTTHAPRGAEGLADAFDIGAI